MFAQTTLAMHRSLARNAPETVMAAGLAVVALLRLGVTTQIVVALYLAAVTPLLVTAEVVRRRLPNILVLPGFAVVAMAVVVAAIVAVGRGAVVDGSGPGGDALSVLAATGAVLAWGLVFRLVGIVGMGDVKLAALLAAALSLEEEPSRTLALIVAGAVSVVGAGMVAFVWLARARPGNGRCHDVPLGPVLLGAYWVALVIS